MVSVEMPNRELEGKGNGMTHYGMPLGTSGAALRYKPLFFARVTIALLCAWMLTSRGMGQELSTHAITNFVTLKPYEKWTGEIPSSITPGKDEKVYLYLKARLNAATFTHGSAFAFRLSVDHIPVTIDRLANKQNSFLIDGRKHSPWYKYHKFYALYDPFDSKPSPAAWGRNHDYFFDITNLIEKGRNLEVVIENMFDSVPGCVLDLKDIKVVVGPKIKRNPFPENPLTYYFSDGFEWAREKAAARNKQVGLIKFDSNEDIEQPVSISNPLVLPDLDAAVTIHDDMKVDVTFPGWSKIPIQTVINTAQYKLQESKDFKTILKKQDISKAVWQTSTYRLERTVSKDRHGVIIEDYVTNLTNRDLPFSILYQLDAGDLSDLKEYRLNGDKMNSFCANSVKAYAIYLRDSRRAYAFFLEDDALRTQGNVFTWDSLVSAGTDMFYLAPKSSHTFRTRLMGAATLSYYEILNRLREAWGMYQTIPGLFGFVYYSGLDRRELKTPEDVKKFFEDTGITIPAVMLQKPLKKGKKPLRRAVYSTEQKEWLREALDYELEPLIAKLRKAGMEHTFLIYMDVNLSRTDGDAEVTKRLKSTFLYDIYGKRMDYRPGWLPLVLPQSDNIIGKQIYEAIKLYFGTRYVKGFFFDEWSRSIATYDFKKSDGITAMLNADMTMKAKAGYVPLLTRAFRTNLVNDLTEQNAIMFANSTPATMIETRSPIVWMAEPLQYDYGTENIKLTSTPLAFTLKRSQNAYDDAYEYLKRGVLTAFYGHRMTGNHLYKHVYPIKVRSLQPGIVIADDKILTLRSGAYYFKDNSPLEGMIFAAPQGRFLRTVKGQTDADGKHKIELELNADKKETALIRRSMEGE